MLPWEVETLTLRSSRQALAWQSPGAFGHGVHLPDMMIPGESYAATLPPIIMEVKNGPSNTSYFLITASHFPLP